MPLPNVNTMPPPRVGRIPQGLKDQAERAPALGVVVMHLRKICTDSVSRRIAYGSLERMIAALPEPIRADIPTMTVNKIQAMSYEDVAELCRQQIQNNRELCSSLYPLLTNADFYPTEDDQVIQVKEIAVVLLTELFLLSQLVAATGCDSIATTDDSGVRRLPGDTAQEAL